MRVGIVGANGYGGIELIRILRSHPKVTIEMLISYSSQGQQMTDQYPQLQNILEMPLEKLEENTVIDRVDILFFATPAGVAKEIAPFFVEAGIKCIDLSGDFRLKDGELYREWYKNTPAKKEFLNLAVYGLPELYRDDIKNKTFISNPGCYPTAALLGMIPVLKGNLINLSSPIIVDGKTGVSGAGRKPSQGVLFSEMSENTKAYKPGSHQHTPEIEQVLHDICGGATKVTFNPHLVPMTRGILCTIYLQLKDTPTNSEMVHLYREFYQEDYFVRVRSANKLPVTKEVYGTNFCDIGVSVDARTNMLTIVSVIDNLCKGAAGQAIQNMNLINGWNEQTGLDHIPVYP